MGFKLTKAEEAARQVHIAELTAAAEALTIGVATFNEELSEIKEKAEALFEVYNQAVIEAREFCQDVAGRISGEVGEKSEKWQEGDKGQEATAWGELWDGALATDCDITFPEEAELHDTDHAELLGDLSAAAGD